MIEILIPIVFWGFIAYKAFINTQKELGSQYNIPQFLIVYIVQFGLAFVWIIMQVFTFFATASNKTSSSNSSSGASAVTFLEKKSKGIYSTYKGQQILGGMLPKRGSIGSIEYFYDGSTPKLQQKRQGIDYYKTNGNVQVFYRNSSDKNKIKFLGTSVDEYNG